MLLQQTRLAPGEDREVLRRLDEAIPLLDTVDLEGGPDVPASAPGPGEIFERLLETGDSPVNGRASELPASVFFLRTTREGAS